MSPSPARIENKLHDVDEKLRKELNDRVYLLTTTSDLCQA
jgi:hypothetical protein